MRTFWGQVGQLKGQEEAEGLWPFGNKGDGRGHVGYVCAFGYKGGHLPWGELHACAGNACMGQGMRDAALLWGGGTGGGGGVQPQHPMVPPTPCPPWGFIFGAKRDAS